MCNSCRFVESHRIACEIKYSLTSLGKTLPLGDQLFFRTIKINLAAKLVKNKCVVAGRKLKHVNHFRDQFCLCQILEECWAFIYYEN